ncbi:MAG: type IX secretion system PorP/SprF family membrane protein [Crocinitomix sp.]|jgi:type IX secretion system PorP/SprF family membrane protein
MKKLFLIILTILSISQAEQLSAQQDAMFTHYSFNTLAVNSGYAGSRDALTVTGLHRSQWMNFPGAPTTQTLTIHAPVANEKLGLGLSLLNDRIGPTRLTSFNIDFAYKIRVGEKGKLAFGLKGGLNMRSSRLASEVTTLEEDDNAFQNDIQTNLLPNFGFGLYYSTSNLYLGVSTPRILENDISLDGQRHYFFIAGTVFPLNKRETLKLRPTAFLKLTSGAPLQLDLTALFYFNDQYWIGPMLRTTDAIGILAGLNLTDQFSMGYSFDWSYGNQTLMYNSGSHELLIRYDFIFKNKGNIHSPRYF